MEHSLNFDSKIHCFRRAPKRLDREACAVLIYDRVLEKQAREVIRLFPRRVAVQAGEGLKSLQSVEKILARVLEMTSGYSRSEICLYALGGGSVGDFVGFCASVLKRGVDVVQIPSTWLSAIDSAHGGKTALNVGGLKNQIGTFWPAREVWLVEDLLTNQPRTRLNEAWGEIYKTGLIAGGKIWGDVQRASRASRPERAVWSLLPSLIRVKMRIVKKDPYEQGQERAVLNLGHTLGHVFEARQGFSHGKAVLFGLAFVVEWTRHLRLMEGKWKAPRWIQDAQSLPHWPTTQELGSLLRQNGSWPKDLARDKKSVAGGQVRFVYIDRPGLCWARKIPLQSLVHEIQRQGDVF